MKTKKPPPSMLLLLQLIISFSIICTASGQDYPGMNPLTGMVEANNKFYGVTTVGGAHNEGVLYEWDPATRVYTKLHDFEVATGRYPWGDVTPLNNKLYGTTDQGGEFNSGVIYEWDISTNTYKVWHEMDWFNGLSPTGKLTYYNGKFYGVATDGGAFGFGAIFEWDPATNVYRKMVDMTRERGRIDGAWLTLYDGKFYGGTIGYEHFSAPNADDAGILFEWDPQTNVFTEKIDMEPINGARFLSTLTLHNGKLYGTTFRGGIYDAGVLFEWDPTTNVYTKKIDLNYDNGSTGLRGPLRFINDKAYGLTFSGGTNGLGVLYEWDPAVNVLTPKVNFDGDNGRHPVGTLAHQNGEMYGVTYFGGAHDAGVLFSWNIATEEFTKQGDFTASEEPTDVPRVYYFTLVDPVSDMDSDAQMGHGMEINVNDRFNIRVHTNEFTQSVAFFINGKRYWGENQEPYALFGDRNGDYNGRRFKPGVYTVVAIPYSENFHTGTVGKHESISFKVIDDNGSTRATSFAEVNVFPNPVAEDLNIEIDGLPNAPIALEIVDEFGNTVKRMDESLNDFGSFAIAMNADYLEGGTYYVTIKMDKETFTKRIVIK